MDLLANRISTNPSIIARIEGHTERANKLVKMDLSEYITFNTLNKQESLRQYEAAHLVAKPVNTSAHESLNRRATVSNISINIL